MTTADDILAVAISQLGYREGAGNRTKYGAWYGLDGQPWCDMFVSWCFEQVGASAIGGHFAYCPSHVNWFKSRGQWITKSQGPQRGDIIFYDWPPGDGTADHVGIVEKVTDGMYPLAIEGNSSDGNTSEGVAVARHARTLSTILGYGRPAYSTSAYRPPFDPGKEEIDVNLDDPNDRAKLKVLIAETLRENIGDIAVSDPKSWWRKGTKTLIAETARENWGDIAANNPNSWWSAVIAKIRA